MQKFWLLLESGRLKEVPAVLQGSISNYAVVYSVDSNIQGQFNFNVTYTLSELGNFVLSKLRILADSELTWVQRNRATGLIQDSTTVEPEILLLDVYKTSTAQPLNVSVTGVTVQAHGSEEFRVLFARRFPVTLRRNNLHGAHFKTATILYPDQFIDWYDLRLRHVDKWSKIHWPIYGYLAEQLNFSFEVTYQLDNYGWLINGTFDGMMGYMQREEVEFPSTGIFVRNDRFAVTSYAASTFPLRATTMFRQPSLSTVRNIFILPFDRSVWLCCFALCLTSVFTLGVQITCSVRQHIEENMLHSDWSDMFTLVLGAICQQGYHLTPTSLAGRTTVFVLTLSSLFLFTSYSANIVALLQTPSTSIQTIHDLAISPMIIEVENQTYNSVYMKETTDRELRDFYHRKIAPLGEKAYLHATIGMKHIKQSMHAFQVDTTSAYKIMSETYQEHEKCGLKEIDLFPAPMFTIATTKGSSLREFFSQRVHWYRNVGLLDRLFKIWMPQKATCGSNAGGFVSVSLTEFYPALMVLQYGTAFSVVILVLEVLSFHRSRIALKLRCILYPKYLRQTKQSSTADPNGNKAKMTFRSQGNWLK
ncbi:glutamate receptor 1-like [Zootermopsis nevadensis]|uniref:glutamate receptor 1-like n=1 Tax=Zootermopsis nevadensis TaxID=136037 RepID=UPI000B8EE864|nr:glutamate receptor 1-like [Zootermopsis nevadensis]